MLRRYTKTTISLLLVIAFAIGFFVIAGVGSSRQSVQADNDTRSTIPLNPRVENIVTFEKSKKVEKEIVTSLNVMYAVHGATSTNMVSAYDYRDNTLLWTIMFDDFIVDGLKLNARGELEVCGSSSRDLCVLLSDSGVLQISNPVNTTVVQNMLNEVSAQENELLHQEEKIKEQKEQKKKDFFEVLNTDETYKAGTTTLASLVLNEYKVFAREREKTKQVLVFEDKRFCSENNEVELCKPDLSEEVLIEQEVLPIQVVSSADFQATSTTNIVEVEQANEATSTDQSKDTMGTTTEADLGPIEGPDGIFDYDDVVDYRTCYHMCYYIEGRSWKTCTAECDAQYLE